MKRRVLKKKVKRTGKKMVGKDNTFHNVLVYQKRAESPPPLGGG